MRSRLPSNRLAVRLALCLALLALSLLGCGAPIATGALPPSSTPGATPTPTAVPSPTATPAPSAVPAVTPVATPGSLVVTLGDDGKTITMRVGERFLLNLGLGGEAEPYDWTAVPADPTVVSRVPNVLTIRGSQGLYEGHKPGQTELTATGEAACRQSRPPCEAPSRSFTVTVVVEP